MKENELSEFMKYAYQTGRVRDVQEAFEEFDPENEWHKGRIENVLKEPKEEYNIYSIGDIVFVKIYNYENGKEGKNHLFVIIDQNNMAIPIENFGMLISSQIEKLKYKSNKFLGKSEENGLNRDSIVKTDIIYKIDNKQILFKIGCVDKEKIEEYKTSYKQLEEIKNIGKKNKKAE